MDPVYNMWLVMLSKLCTFSSGRKSLAYPVDLSDHLTDCR